MRKFLLLTSAVAVGLLTPSLSAFATVIDNDVPSGNIGAFEVDVTEGGESRTANLTASGRLNSPITDNVLFDYFSYVDTGSGGTRLPATNVTTPVTSTGDDTVTSAGNFTGSGGNTIDWSVTSTIPDNGSKMTSDFEFSARSGSLGDLRFFRYLDEDVISFIDNVFFTRGSAAGEDLQLFTIEPDEVVGISQSGGFSSAQGLANSGFAGWAADEFDQMKPDIVAGTQNVAVGGVIDPGLADDGTTTVSGIGTTRGPTDVVSTLAWDVNSNSSSATIRTSLGGVPQAQDIPTETVPIPSTLALLAAGFGALGFEARRRRG